MATTYSTFIDGTYGKPQRKQKLDKKGAHYVITKTIDFSKQNLDASASDVLRCISIPAKTLVLDCFMNVITAETANAVVDLGYGTDTDYWGNGLPVDATGIVATVLSQSGTWDAATIGDGNEEAKDVTVNSALLGDHVIVSSSIDVTDLTLVGAVTATDTVTLQLGNWTGGNVNLDSMTYDIRVIKAPLRHQPLYFSSADTIDILSSTAHGDVNMDGAVIQLFAICLDYNKID